MKTLANGQKVVVIGSTGTKYTVSKSKDGKSMLCSCPRWTTTSPRKDCKHIVSVLTGKPVEKKVKKMKHGKVVVKALVSPKAESLNVKKASEVIYKLISKAPGKLVRESLREKSGLDRSTVAGACKALWKAKKIRRTVLKSGSAGPYILYPKVRKSALHE